MSIKAKILLPVITLTLLVSAAILVVNILLFSNHVDEEAINTVTVGSEVALHHLDDKHGLAESAAMSISENPDIAAYVLSNDIASLLALSQELQAKAETDFCTITDAQGIVVARAHDPARRGDSLVDIPSVSAAMAGTAKTAVESGTVIDFAVRSAMPIYYEDEIVGTVSTGYRLDTETFVDEVKEISGCENAVLKGDTRVATTIYADDGTRAVGTKADPRATEPVLAGETFTGEVDMLSRRAIAIYTPIYGSDGEVVGMFFVGRYVDDVNNTIQSFIQSTVIIGVAVIAIFVVIMLLIASRIVRPIRAMTNAASALAVGDTDIDVVVTTKDEMRTLGTAFNQMVADTRRQVQIVDEIAKGERIKPVELRSEKDIMNRALDQMNNTLRAQSEALKEEHDRVKLMLDATPLAARLWDRDHELIDCN